MNNAQTIILSGGVGGAKLVLGMSHILAPEQLTVVTNTGDDFDHYGLRICPIQILPFTPCQAYLTKKKAGGVQKKPGVLCRR